MKRYSYLTVKYSKYRKSQLGVNSIKQYTFVLITLFVLFSCGHHDTIDNKAQSFPKPECNEGSTRQGFITSQTFGDMPCTQGMQTCFSGKWTGPEIYETCQSLNKSCDGRFHGTTESGYLHPIGICIQETRRCDNGTWIGPAIFPSCTPTSP